MGTKSHNNHNDLVLHHKIYLTIIIMYYHQIITINIIILYHSQYVMIIIIITLPCYHNYHYDNKSNIMLLGSIITYHYDNYE